MRPSVNYTELFYKHRGAIRISNQFTPYSKSHPFEFLTLGSYLKQEFKFSYQFEEYWKIQNNIKEEESKALNLFELEVSMLHFRDRSSYLNDAVEILIKIHEKITANQKIQADADLKTKRWTETYFPFYNLLEISNKKIFTYFYLNYHSLLNSKNFKYLSSLYDFKEPLKSFRRVRTIPDKKFEELFKKYIINKGLLPKKTPFRVFKEFFLGKEMKQKMDWQGPLGALGYFIKQLRDKEAIHSPQDEWKVTAEFFTFKGLSVPKTVNVQSAPREDLKKDIDLFVRGMLEV